MKFQTERAKEGFLNSIPGYIKDEILSPGNDDLGSEQSSPPVEFVDKLKDIKTSIEYELRLYDYLKVLKKENNQKKRLPLKKQKSN